MSSKKKGAVEMSSKQAGLFVGDRWETRLSFCQNTMLGMELVTLEHTLVIGKASRVPLDADGECEECGGNIETGCFPDCEEEHEPRIRIGREAAHIKRNRPVKALEAALHTVVADKDFDPTKTKLIECCCSCYRVVAVTRINGELVLAWSENDDEQIPDDPDEWELIPLDDSSLAMLIEFLRLSKNKAWEIAMRQ